MPLQSRKTFAGRPSLHYFRYSFRGLNAAEHYLTAGLCPSWGAGLAGKEHSIRQQTPQSLTCTGIAGNRRRVGSQRPRIARRLRERSLRDEFAAQEYSKSPECHYRTAPTASHSLS
jgi:hypothetical protein